jgi:hypothetical protein
MVKQEPMLERAAALARQPPTTRRKPQAAAELVALRASAAVAIATTTPRRFLRSGYGRDTPGHNHFPHQGNELTAADFNLTSVFRLNLPLDPGRFFLSAAGEKR